MSFDDDEDDDLNIDTANLTQEEKNDIKMQRKLRKMYREKQKRSKLNNQFDYLCKILAMGRSTRVEKLTVLNETIRVVRRLKAENDGLKEQKRRMKNELQRIRSGGAAACPVNSEVVKTEVFLQPQGCVKQESFFSHNPFIVKQEPCVAKSVKQESSPYVWGSSISNPNNDLDFAFGPSQQPCQRQQYISEEYQVDIEDDFAKPIDLTAFPCFEPPVDAGDSVDMFLNLPGDASNDLLCF